MNKKYTYLVVVILIVACLVAFGRILGNGFINFDDETYLTKNLAIQSGINVQTVKWAFTTSYASNWQPLSWLSHMLDWRLFGANASGHHFVSLLLHIGSTLILFLFLNRITNTLGPSVFVAALFALHPLRVESVAWAVERKDVLSMFFGLSALYAYALYVEKHRISIYCLSLLLFVLGLMAKPMLVSLPFILLLLDFWPLARLRPADQAIKSAVKGNVDQQVKKKTKKQKSTNTGSPGVSKPVGQNLSQLIWGKIPFFVFALLSSILTIWAQSKGGAVASLQRIPVSDRIINAVVSYVAYLGKIFWPVDLAVFYPYSHTFPAWQVLGAILILLAITIVAVVAVKKAPYFLVGWLWYLGTLVPVIGLIQVGKQAMADRYTYLPSIGIGIMLAWSAFYLLPKEKIRKFVFIPVVAVVLTALILLTWRQCDYWKNSIELFSYTVKATKDNYLAYTNLGLALAAGGRNEEAIHNYQEAIRINARYDNAHYNLANILAKQGKTEEAISHYREAVRINPGYSIAYNNLGVNLVKLRKYDDAIFYYRQALQIEQNNPGFHLNLGVALVDKGDLKEAIEHLRTAVYLNPDYSEARRVLKLALEIDKRQKRD